MANETCFYPDGTTAFQMLPCDDEAPFTHCCYYDGYCLSNRMCFDQIRLLVYRGTCSSPSWVDGFCGDVCLEYDQVAPIVTPCLAETVNGVVPWVCAKDDCANTSQLFELPPSRILLNKVLASDLSLPTDTTSSSTFATHTRLSIGLALGLPLLASLVLLLVIWLRRRSDFKFTRQRQVISQQQQTWPAPPTMPANHTSRSDSEVRTIRPAMPIALPSYNSMILPELGDDSPHSTTSGVTSSNSNGTFAHPARPYVRSNAALVQHGRDEDRQLSQLEWDAMADREEREMNSQAQWDTPAC